MNSIAILQWARGTGLQVAVVIFLIGVAIHLVEMWMVGRNLPHSLDRYRAGAPL